MSAPPLEIVIDSIALPQITARARRSRAPRRSSRLRARPTLTRRVAGGEAHRRPAGSRRLALRRSPLRAGEERARRRPEARRAERMGLIAELLQLRGAAGDRGRRLPAAGRSTNGRPISTCRRTGCGSSPARCRSRATGPAIGSLAKLAAALDTLVPEDYAALVAGESSVDLDLSRADNGAIAIDSATLQSEGVDFAAQRRRSAPTWCRSSAKLSLKLGQAGRAELPFLPATCRWRASTRTPSSSPAMRRRGAWRSRRRASEGDFGSVAGFALNATGQAKNLARPDSRAANFKASGSAEGLVLADADLRARGRRVGEAQRRRHLGRRAAGRDRQSAGHAGRRERDVCGDGDARELSTARLPPRSAISRASPRSPKRPLAGGVDLQGERQRDDGRDVRPEARRHRDRTWRSVSRRSIRCLTATTRIEGGIARREDGFAFDALKLSNDRVTAEVTGSFAEPALDLAVSASVADLALVTPRASGAASVTAQLTGSRDAPQVEAEASGENVVLMGRPLSDATARFSGVVAGPQTAGEAEISGTLGETPVSGTAKLSAGERRRARARRPRRFRRRKPRRGRTSRSAPTGFSPARSRSSRPISRRSRRCSSSRRAAWCAPTSSSRPRAARSRRRFPARRPTSSTRTSRSNPPTSQGTCAIFSARRRSKGNSRSAIMTAGGLHDSRRDRHGRAAGQRRRRSTSTHGSPTAAPSSSGSLAPERWRAGHRAAELRLFAAGDRAGACRADDDRRSRTARRASSRRR